MAVNETRLGAFAAALPGQALGAGGGMWPLGTSASTPGTLGDICQHLCAHSLGAAPFVSSPPGVLDLGWRMGNGMEDGEWDEEEGLR